jgi:cytochrome c
LVSEATGSDNMPGSFARRKRDNSVELVIGIRFPAARRGRPPGDRTSRPLVPPTGPRGKPKRTMMASFEWNKIIASVLTAMIVAMVSGILASQLVHPKHLEHPVYLPPGAEAGAAAATSAGATQAVAGPEPIDMAKADPAKGQLVAKVCLQCHTFDKGGANKIGPNLWDILQENIASVPNYQFSPALVAHKAEKWDPDKLNVWLFKPQTFAKGTKMTFPGLPKPQDRADVVAYLESLK